MLNYLCLYIKNVSKYLLECLNHIDTQTQKENSMNRIFITILFLSCFCSLQAKKGYEIKVKIDGFSEKELFLAYHYGGSQYIKDTVNVGTDGYFTFAGEEALDCGLYLAVLPPNNDIFQILIEDNQHFSMTTQKEDLVGAMQVKDSKNNIQFYEYLQFLNTKGKEAKTLREEKEALGDNEKKTKPIQEKLNTLDKAVKEYQRKAVDKSPNSLLAAIISGSWEVQIPKELKDKERYLYAKKHWFDNINFKNSCLLRSPILNNKADYYIEKLTPQHPDSISQSVDAILEKARPNEDIFKYFLVTYLNKYAKSKIVGMDAVYVHIAEKYYASGQAPWTDEEQLLKIVENAEKLKPLLIGKTAPEIKVPELDIDGTLAIKDAESEHKRFKLNPAVSLQDIDSPFTILFIWSPDCGHCKKSMPDIIKFYDEYKEKGVKLYSICHKNYKETPSCAEFIKERPEMMTWLNLTDPYFRSRYAQIYDVKSTPQVYILDEKKEILSKRIGAKQLPEVMDALIEMKAKEKEKQGK